MKSILVPIDFSEQADFAVEVAAQIAKQAGASIQLLHTVDVMILNSDAPAQVTHSMELAKAIEADANNKMVEWKQKPYLEGVEVTSEVKMENTFHGIVGETERLDVDLIVMGTKGVSGLKEFFIGSNAEKVIRWSEIPVLTVKNRMPNFSIKEVLFVSNFYGEIDLTFEKVMKFFNVFNPKFHLLKVITPNNFEASHRSTKIIEDFADKAKIKDFTINTYNDTSFEEGVKHFDELINPDVIVMPTHGRKGLAHLIYGSKAEDAVNHIGAPILTFKIVEPEFEYGVIFPETK